MKNQILITVLLLLSIATHAQTKVTKDATGNYKAINKPKDTTNKPTGNTFTDSKGKVWPVYKGAQGGLFVLRVSKAGKEYKQYLKID